MKGVPALFASMKSLLNTSKNEEAEHEHSFWYEAWHGTTGNFVGDFDTREEAEQYIGDLTDVDIIEWCKGCDYSKVVTWGS